MNSRPSKKAIRPLREPDLPMVSEMLNYYIEHTVSNFRTEPRSLSEWKAEWQQESQVYPWLVAEDSGTAVAVAYAGAWNPRPAYEWCVTTTVYVDGAMAGRGIGKTLYQELLSTLRRQGFLTAMAKVALPNPASIALHESVGFKLTGTIANAGFKHGAWHDVSLWQRELAPVRTPPVPVTKYADLSAPRLRPR